MHFHMSRRICIHTHVHVCGLAHVHVQHMYAFTTYVRAYIYTHLYTYKCTYFTWNCVHILICMHVRYMQTCMVTLACRYVHAHVYVCVYLYRQTHACIHRHISAYTQTLASLHPVAKMPADSAVPMLRCVWRKE